MISVAVSTYNRRKLLPRLIDALERQTVPSDLFEVVITNDASTDGSRELLDELAASSSLNMRVIHNGTNAGPANGRNAAWRAGSGTIVAFTDDDCVPSAGWLQAGLEAMRSGTDIVVGQTSPAPDQRHLLGPFSRTMWTTDERYYATCNIFYNRTDLEAVGGFDDGFPYPGGEDTDLAYRVRKLGRRPAFCPQALVHHDVRPSSFRATLRETMRWEGIVRLVARHPRQARDEHLYRRYFWKHSHPPVILATFGLLFGIVFPPALFLTVPYLRFRLITGPRTNGRLARYLAFPGTFVIDLLEVYVMARASIRYRTLVL
jgi:GT2 family glycosyltransferase